MLKNSYPFITICLLMAMLAGCAINPPPSGVTLKEKSYLQQGERYFEKGYYKRAMRILLPLASDGNTQAQYAVGYMYYYGYGVAQDTEIGDFWIRRAANKGNPQAIRALQIISMNKKKVPGRHPG